MKRVLLVVFTLALNASLALAQDAQSSSSDSNSNNGNTLRTFWGCLSRSNNQYELTVGGVAPRQYQLLGPNLAQLDAETGHLVSITGTIPENLQFSTNSNAESNTINFLSVEDLASTCAASSDRGQAAKTRHSISTPIPSAQKPWQSLTESNIILMSDPQSHPGSYMIVPLVGGLALGLLQLARYWRRK